MQTHDNSPALPTPGSPAYWRAQREATALFRTFRDLMDDPDPLLLLPVLRGIAAHGCARRMLAIPVSCEDHIASWSVPNPDDYDGMPGGAGHEPPPGGDRPSRACPAEIGFDSGGLHVRVEFGVSNGSAGMTVFVAPADEDAAPGMDVLHLAPPARAGTGHRVGAARPGRRRRAGRERVVSVAAVPDTDRFDDRRRADAREHRADAIAAGDPTE